MGQKPVIRPIMSDVELKANESHHDEHEIFNIPELVRRHSSRVADGRPPPLCPTHQQNVQRTIRFIAHSTAEIVSHF